MPTTSSKKSNLNIRPDVSFVKVDNSLNCNTDNPFFLKKEARAKETIRKYGLPRDAATK